MKILPFEKVVAKTTVLRKRNKKVVYVHGIFDILHRGHVHLLVEAKRLGDILVVGVDCDENARSLKGEKRPINNLESRTFVLSQLKPIDYIFVIPEFDRENVSDIYIELYKKLKPDILATSVKSGKYGQAKQYQAEKSGVKFVDISDYIHDKNTTKIIELLNL